VIGIDPETALGFDDLALEDFSAARADTLKAKPITSTNETGRRMMVLSENKDFGTNAAKRSTAQNVTQVTEGLRRTEEKWALALWL